MVLGTRHALLVAALLATPASAELALVPVSTYDTGLGANGAEIISIRKKDSLAALTNVAGSVDIIDLSNLAAPALVRRIAVGPGTPNSVAIPSERVPIVLTGLGPADVTNLRSCLLKILCPFTHGVLP